MFKTIFSISFVVLQSALSGQQPLTSCLAFSNNVHQTPRTRKSFLGITSLNLAKGFFESLYELPKEKGKKTVTTRLPLGNLFDSREYIFECATNMRGYEWTTKEAEELLDDLADASFGRFDSEGKSKQEDYELGQIVLVPMDWDQKRFGLGQKYDVHDGQQRLVTLCLILASLRSSFRGEKGMEDTTSELGNMLNPPKVRKDDILRIQLRKRDNEMLNRILKVELDTLNVGKELRDTKNMAVANRSVLENYGRLVFRIGSFTNEERLKLLDFLCERVHMLVCVPDTASIARNIVMSQGKGKDNEPIDDFKGLICFKYTDKEDDMYDTFDNWDRLAAPFDIENDAVGRDIISDACLLRASAVLRSKINKNGQIYAMENWLRAEMERKAMDGKAFFNNHVEPASLALGSLRDLNYIEKAFSFSQMKNAGKTGNMIAMRLTFLRALTASIGATKELEIVILELLLQSMGKGQDKRMPLGQFDNYLGHVERLALWMALVKPPASERYKRCFDFLETIQSKNDSSFSFLSEEEKTSLREQLATYEFGLTPSGRKIAAALIQRLNAYALFGVDKETTSGGVQLNIEQILPLKASTAMWGEDWPDKEEKEFWVHRLGNFVLLSKKANARVSRKSFAVKKERYEKEVWPLTINVSKMDVWNRGTLVEHMTSMLNMVEEIWGL